MDAEVTFDLDGAVRQSVGMILRNQSPNGAIVASPDFGEYQYCWLRDSSFISYSLDVAGEHEASARYHAWVNDAVSGIAEIIDRVIKIHREGGELDPTHMPPARFSLDGHTVGDDWPNFQIDGYGTWLWSLGKHLELTGQTEVPSELQRSVQRVARYLAELALSPCYDVWEENGNARHTSTLACVYGGLIAAASLLGDEQYLQVAGIVQSRVLESAERVGYYVKSNINDDVDGSIVWLTAPFAVVDATDAYFEKTVALIQDRLTFEGGIRRYSTDVYYGSGTWPVLTASLGWHFASAGDLDGARTCRNWITARFDKYGHLAEQFDGELRDRPHYDEWVARWGLPAQDLTWSHAMYVILCLAIAERERSLLEATSRQTEKQGGAKNMSL